MQKLTIYLKSGQTLSMKCKSVKFTYDSATGEYEGYQINSVSGLLLFGIVPSQIAAYTVEVSE